VGEGIEAADSGRLLPLEPVAERLTSWGTENEGRDRRVLSAAEITDEEADLIARAEVSAQHRDLDSEIVDGVSHVRARIARADPAMARAVLALVPDRAPMEGDELPG
jgi:hypothetical protein